MLDLQSLNYSEDSKDQICVGCAYFNSRGAVCQLTLQKVVAIGHCNGYSQAVDNNDGYLGKIKLIGESFPSGNFTYSYDGIEYPTLHSAAIAEVSQRLNLEQQDDGAIITNGNKIIVLGEVLPLSEYETIADEVMSDA